MSIQDTIEIPSAFLRLDDRITSDDQYLNVRDQKIIRDNSNVLLGRRCKRQLAAQSFQSETVSTLSNPLDSAQPADRQHGDVMMSVPLKLSRGTKELSFVFDSARDAEGVNVVLYGALDAPQEHTELQTGASVTVSATSRTKYTMTLVVPPLAWESNIVNFYLYMEGGFYGSDRQAAALSISDAGSNWFKTTTSMAAGATPVIVGDVMYVPNDLSIHPRKITRLLSNTHAIINRPFNRIPTTTNTMNARPSRAVQIWSWAIYENAVYDYDANVEIP